MADYEHCVVLTTTESSEVAEALANGAVEAETQEAEESLGD